jgi:hypothetical protein
MATHCMAPVPQLGSDEGDFDHLNLRGLIPDRYKHEFDDYLKRVKEHGKDEGFMKILTRDGREFIIEYKNALVYDSQVTPVGV